MKSEESGICFDCPEKANLNDSEAANQIKELIKGLALNFSKSWPPAVRQFNEVMAAGRHAQWSGGYIEFKVQKPLPMHGFDRTYRCTVSLLFNIAS